jgi:hypothetical protein
MLALQIQMMMAWLTTKDRALRRWDDESERGEVTATMAMIALLVAAAVVAAGIIAVKMSAHANKVPNP